MKCNIKWNIAPIRIIKHLATSQIKDINSFIGAVLCITVLISVICYIEAGPFQKRQDSKLYKTVRIYANYVIVSDFNVVMSTHMNAIVKIEEVSSTDNKSNLS